MMQDKRQKKTVYIYLLVKEYVRSLNYHNSSKRNQFKVEQVAVEGGRKYFLPLAPFAL